MKHFIEESIFVFMAIFMLASCGNDDDGGPSILGPAETESVIIGSWIREVVVNYSYAGLSFLDDGTYYYVNMTSPTEEPHTSREGTYTIEGKTLTLGSDNATCTGDGVYEVSITEDKKKMTLKKISDDCEVRAGELPGDWQSIEE